MNPQSPYQPVQTPHHQPQGDDGARQAAQVTQQQIAHIYNTAPPNQTNQHASASQEFDWRTYHAAWQQYYQQYYQRYYWQQLHSERQKLAATAADQAMQDSLGKIAVGADPNTTVPTKAAAFKKDIRKKVAEHAKKLRASNHFVPIVSALVVGLIVIFLQFNSVVIAQVQSYISPGAISSTALNIDPTAPVNVGPEAKLIIPKINVDVPVDYAVATTNEQQIQVSLRDGATHYNLPGASALPGQNGNTVILGHSSNDIFNQGAYKFVFVLLDRLQPGDVFYLHYNGTRYIYKVTSTKVINPTDLAALQTGTSKPMATLITCTPPGTALQRLLVFGEQISPDPAGASAAAAQQPASQSTTTLAGNEPTILDQIWQFFF